MSAFLKIDGLVKRFGGFAAVDGVSLAITRGQILALLGPSGSGKTTVLRLLAGFESADAGRIEIDGGDVTHLSPVARRCGMVFQHYALFPHLNAGENVAFGLRTQGLGGAGLERRVAEALALVEMTGFAHRRIGELSGGQQQRIALARALAPEPRVLLLDEPLSNLDPALREKTRRELRDVIRRVGITTVLVTHEQEEAFELGDLVAVLRHGRIEQAGTAETLYDSPASAFVAGFVGRASTLAGEVLSSGPGGTRVRVEGADWLLAAPWPGAAAPKAETTVVVLARPEALRLVGFDSANSGESRDSRTPGASDSAATLEGTVTARRFTGAQAFFTVTTAAGSAVEISATPDAVRLGDRVGIALSLSRGQGVHLFPAPAPSPGTPGGESTPGIARTPGIAPKIE